ncbi:MAG: hypothetical protein BAA03_08745 [Caldibacillus debilis]|nr:MAG: hypothetical protein BAA03_08745 [Caldibacillus debilis]
MKGRFFPARFRIGVTSKSLRNFCVPLRGLGFWQSDPFPVRFFSHNFLGFIQIGGRKPMPAGFARFLLTIGFRQNPSGFQSPASYKPS